MRPETKQHLHFGINFILAPTEAVTPAQQLQFQAALADPVNGIVFDAVQKTQAGVMFARQAEPLQVTIGPIGPQVGQLLITAAQPARTLAEFISDAEIITSTYRTVWAGPLQVLRRDVTIRHLYAVQEQHAFQFIWERRLHQMNRSMEVFGRPVLGGGLRIVMPPRPGVADDASVEVKIESLMADPRQLFVEATFVWATLQPSADLEPKSLLEHVEQYLETEVQTFILSE